MTHIIELHLDIDAPGQNPVALLAEQTGLSKQKVKQAMQKGALWISRGENTRRLRRAKAALHPGERLHLYYNEAVLAEVPAEPRLVADEGGYSVWYKPYGLRSQGSKWGDHCTIHRWLELNLQPQRPAFIVHRLDRAASGLILIAHSKAMAAAFSRLFRERAISKHYQVVVHGEFPASGEARCFDGDIDGKHALSYARRLAYDGERERSLLAVDIDTGRKHQIRRHLSEAGFPVVGDRLYGREGDGDGEDLQLSAVELSFIHPEDGEPRRYRLESGDAERPIAAL